MSKLLAAGLIIYIIILEIRLLGYASYVRQIQEHLLHHDDILEELYKDKLDAEK